MYKIKVVVPRITVSFIAELEKVMPGLGTVTEIPLIDSEEAAQMYAERIAMKQLGGEDVMDDKPVFTETETEWEVVFSVWGEDD